MLLLLEAIGQITLPIAILMAIGYVVQRYVAMDPKTLGVLLIHVVLPGAIVHFLTASPLPLAEVWITAVAAVAQFVLLFGIGLFVAGVTGVKPGVRWFFAMAVAYPNSANFGIPVAEMVFGFEWVLHQSVISSVHVVMVVVGVSIFLKRGDGSVAQALKAAAKTPLVLAVLVGLLLNGSGRELPAPAAQALEFMAGALTPLALVILGTQLVGIELGGTWKSVASVTVLRLAVAPAVTFGVLLVSPVPEDLQQLIVVASCAPVGVMLAVLVAARREYAGFVSAAIATTTVLSPLAVAIVVAALHVAIRVP